jgi:hypothetical protein
MLLLIVAILMTAAISDSLNDLERRKLRVAAAPGGNTHHRHETENAQARRMSFVLLLGAIYRAALWAAAPRSKCSRPLRPIAARSSSQLRR